MSYHRKSLGADPSSTSSLPVEPSTVAAGALVYHGYRRTGSILWALLYGLAGKKVPLVAVPVALAQGFGKKKNCTTEE